jgi:hypothetical protein
LFWMISGSETTSAGSYSIADRATQHAALAQKSVQPWERCRTPLGVCFQSEAEVKYRQNA